MERENAEVEDLADRFHQLYPFLKSELLEDPAFGHDSFSRQWISKMLDFNVPRDDLHRGLSVVETYMLLKANLNGSITNRHQFPAEEVFLATVLGWCIQWLVGCVLVLDDVLNNSYNPMEMTAVNDAGLLGVHIKLILKKHFHDRTYYVDLLHLFNEAEYQTAYGEMLDLINVEKDVSLLTPALQRRISMHKTAFGMFYLPFECALFVLGEKLEGYEHDHVKTLLLEMGVYFQVQDDYLDCFGDSEKIGTDIQRFKCSWLVVKALELCNEEQRKVLFDHYGKGDQASVVAVKRVYEELNLQGVYAEYEIDMYEDLLAKIQGVPSKAVQAVLNEYLGKIHNRRK